MGNQHLRAMWTIGHRATRAYLADRANTFAAAIAYHTLFSIFPLSLFVIGLAGYFITKGQRAELVRRLAQALGGASSGNIQRQIDLVANGRAGISILGLIIALWSASAVFGAVRTGLGIVWKHERHTRWYRAKAQDLCCVVGFGALLILSLSGTITLTALNSIVRQLLGKHLAQLESIGFGIVLVVAPMAVACLTFMGLYILTAPRSVPRRRVLPGALVAAGGFQALSLSFGYFIRSFGRFDKVYGSLGTVIAFLLYAYLVSSVILFGAEVAFQYALWRAGAVSSPLDPDDAALVFVPRPREFTNAD